MNKIIVVITIAFSARKKRKLFADEAVREEFARLTKEGLAEKGINVSDLRYFDDHPEAVAVTVDAPMGMEPRQVFNLIKSVSKKELCEKFFPYAETLWTRNYWCCQGTPTEDEEHEMLSFIALQRGRN